MPLHYARRTIQAYGRHFYQLRIASGVEKSGFLMPLPRHIDGDALYNDVIGAAMRWRLLAIAFFRRPDGSEYRCWCEAVTGQHVAAQGKELVPVMQHVIQGAEAEGEAGSEAYDYALAMRAFDKGYPDMRPIIRRHQRELALSDTEVRGILPSK